MRALIHLAVGLGLAATTAVGAVVELSNYGGASANDAYPVGNAGNTFLKSVGNIGPDVFLIDDFVIPGDLEAAFDLSAISWIGYHEDNGALGYSAEVVFFEYVPVEENDDGFAAQLTPILSLTGQDFTMAPLDSISDGGGGTDLSINEYSVDLSDTGLLLAPGAHVFVGARLVSNLAGSGDAGLWFSNAGGVISPLRAAAKIDNHPAINVDWHPVDEAPTLRPETEFAYLLTGAVIPEPASLALLAMAGLLFARRR